MRALWALAIAIVGVATFGLGWWSGRDALRTELAAPGRASDRGVGGSLGTTASEPVTDSNETSPELARLRSELARAEAQITELRRLLAERSTQRSKSAYDPAFIASASDRFDTLIAKRDVRGLWELAGRLLEQGEPGFDQLTELLARFELAIDGEDRELRRALEGDDLFQQMHRFLSEHPEAIVRYALHLRAFELDSLPQAARNLRTEMRDDLGPVVMGYYQGGAEDVIAEYVTWLLDSDPSRESRAVIYTLAETRGESARAALLEYVNYGAFPTAMEAVRALGARHEQASIDALRDILPRAKDPKLAAEIERVLEAQ